MATAALFVALASGTAFAATQLGKESVGTRQLVKEAVTPSKLSDASKATLTGPQGPSGATGPQGPQGAKGDPGDPGAPGSAVAYARVTYQGTLDTAHSKNIASASLSALTGVYCITPSVPVNTVVASAPHFPLEEGVFVEANIVANHEPSTPYCSSPVWVSVTNPKNQTDTLEDHAFYLIFD